MSHGLQKFKTNTTPYIINEKQQLNKFKMLNKLRLKLNPKLPEATYTYIINFGLLK